MSDWLDDILDGVPTPITYMQLVIIETKINNTNLPQSEKDYIMSNLLNFTELEAEEIITKILENEIQTDPRKQWQKMFKDGVFESRDI